MKAVANGQALALRLVVAGRHAFMGDEEIMQPSRARQADLIGGVENRGGVAQEIAGMVERHRLQESFGRKPGPAGEQPLQMVRRQARFFGDGLERGLVAPVLVTEGQRLLDDRIVAGGRGE